MSNIEIALIDVSYEVDWRCPSCGRRTTFKNFMTKNGAAHWARMLEGKLCDWYRGGVCPMKSKEEDDDSVDSRYIAEPVRSLIDLPVPPRRTDETRYVKDKDDLYDWSEKDQRWKGRVDKDGWPEGKNDE